MSYYEPRQANQVHNEDICQIFRNTPMEGAIAIRFEREPDYFVGARIQNLEQHIILGYDTQKEKAFAIANLGNRPVFIGDKVEIVRYFCDLRVLPEYRNRTLLVKGFRYLGKEVLTGDLYAQALIVSDNRKALDTLTSGRAGLPHFYYTDDYHTWAISTSQKFKSVSDRFAIRRASADDVPMMQKFLEDEGPGKLFFPAYNLHQVGSHPYYANQRIEDYYLAFHQGQLVGMAGAWDLEFCKQSRVVSYSRSIRWSRPLFNRLGWLNRGFQLPAEGSLLHYFVLHTVLVRQNDPEVLSALIKEIASSRTQYDYCLLGLAAADPLNAAVLRMHKRLYRASHYLISYGKPSILEQDTKNYYLEAARL